jgi:hypothetical protein
VTDVTFRVALMRGPVKLLPRVVRKIPQIWPKKAYAGAVSRPKKA